MNHKQYITEGTIIVVNTNSYRNSFNETGEHVGFDSAGFLALLAAPKLGGFDWHRVDKDGSVHINQFAGHDLHTIGKFTKTGDWKILTEKELDAMVKENVKVRYTISVECEDGDIPLQNLGDILSGINYKTLTVKSIQRVS